MVVKDDCSIFSKCTWLVGKSQSLNAWANRKVSYIAVTLAMNFAPVNRNENRRLTVLFGEITEEICHFFYIYIYI